MSGTPPSSSNRRFWQALREESSVLDVALVLSVPAVLLAVMTLPQSTRLSFAFDYASPSPVSAFASSFVHLTSTHLALNLVVYGLVVGVAYLLSVLSGRRRRFRVTFVSLVLATPLLIPYLNLAIVRRGATVGFSGVLMALYGYLAVALGTYLERQFDIGNRTIPPLLFFAGLSLMTVLTLAAVLLNPVVVPVQGVPVPVTSVLAGTLVSLTGALLLVVVLYLTSASAGWREVGSKLHAAVDRPGYIELAVVAGAVFLAIPVATFPLNPASEGSVLNLYSHLVGYSLGFIATYASVATERWLFDRSATD